MDKLNILFLCTGNSCRSQMSEAWAKALKSETIKAYSAGIEAHGLNPYAVKVMNEAGIDMTTQSSKQVDEISDISFDYVIAVCGHAAEHCPSTINSAQLITYTFDDPPALTADEKDEETKLNAYRRVRDEIKDFILSLPGALPGQNCITLQSS